MSAFFIFMGLLPLLILCSILNIQQIYALNNSEPIYSKDSKPFGKSFDELMHEGYVQHLGNPSDLRENYSPEKCAWNQNNENVYFLPGGASVSAQEAKKAEVRQCEVPSGKAIELIIYGGTCNETEEGTYEGRKACAELGLGKDDRDTVKFEVKVDGVLVMDAMDQSKLKVEKYLPNCGEIIVTINSTQNTYDYPPGPHQTYNCGIPLIIPPPSVGSHNISVYQSYTDPKLPVLKPEAFWRSSNVTYNITVR